MIHALIFDFDGLILETEGPSYQSWVEMYHSFGVTLDFLRWSSIIGTTQADFNPLNELQKLVSEPVDWDMIEARRAKREMALLEAQSILPGVEAYLNDASRLGLKIGLASSSSCRWVVGHLARLGLLARFDCLRASDDVQRVKPDPELYLSVLAGLQVEADEAVALEDSPLGVRSAQQAGIFCIVVPNSLTSQLSLDEADYQLSSLAEIPLEQLLEQVNAIKTQGAAG